MTPPSALGRRLSTAGGQSMQRSKLHVRIDVLLNVGMVGVLDRFLRMFKGGV